MSITIGETSGNGVIKLNDVDKITINNATQDISLAGTNSIKIPVGTTAQRPTPVTGDMRYNTTNTAAEFYNGVSWRTIGALDGSSSALAAPSAVYLRDIAGVTQNGTYWITVNGTPTEIYCNFTTAGGGWMSFASAPGSGNWFSGNTGNIASWAPNSLNYSYGTYSKAGSIGDYWRNYFGQSVTELLFITGNGTYWLSFPISYVASSSSYITYTSGVVTSNNFPSNAYSANTTVSVMHRSGQPEDPWINAGNQHANGGDASGTDFMFWGENATTGHLSFKNANGGTIAFVR